MNAIELIESTFVIKSAKLRHTVDERGEPWFIAKDVCDYLELENVSQACKRLFEGYARISPVYTENGEKEMLTVNEPGLYQLIFQSRKPEAVAFQRWVMEDLLPSLRRNGHYQMPGQRVAWGTRVTRHGRQPFADEIKKRGITQGSALEGLNAIDLPGVPEVANTHYGSAIKGLCRPSRAFTARAAAYLGVPAEDLFTAPVRD